MGRLKFSAESGFALLPTMIFLLILAFAILLLIWETNLNNTRSLQSLTLSSLQQSLSVGSEDAANQLNSYSNWPEIITQSGGTILPGYQPLPANSLPTTPVASFWQNCTANQQCQQTTVTINETPITVQWTIFPSNGFSIRLNGYAIDSGNNSPTEREYVAFIHAQYSNTGINSTIEVILKKSLL